MEMAKEVKMKNWKGTRALITGGTSGLGFELARQLSALGADVAVVARSAKSLKSVSETYPKIHTIEGDVSKKDRIYPVLGEANQKLGGVDILFNNASSLGPTPLRILSDTDCEDFETALQTNLLGPFRLTKGVLAQMRLNGGGTIVNISSDAAVSAYPKWGVYGASKAALDHLTRIWQSEYPEKEIRFFAVDPGDMKTPLHFSAVPDANPSDLRDPKDSARMIIEDLSVKLDQRSGETRWRLK